MTSGRLHFAGRPVLPGTLARVELPAGRLPSGHELSLHVQVARGREPGPTLWLSGAVHGDEIVGVEIIRQVVERLDPRSLRGTVVAVPVVNVFGFVTESRYLPDRRDLNRSFPGSARGALASRLARLFMDEIVARCSIGIDFHAGSDDRINLPQIRGNLDDWETRALARAFGAPLAIHAKPIKGTLREAAGKAGKRILVFEGGEPRRFSPESVEAGVVGTLRVLGALGMIDAPPSPPLTAPLESRATVWTRAPRGGILRLECGLGMRVEKGERLGVIGEPSARGGVEVRARVSGIVIGHAVNPLVHRGDGLVHVAEIEGTDPPSAKAEGAAR